MAWKALLVCLCFFGASFADSLYRNSRNNEQSKCIAGTFINGTVCTPCPKGTYSNKSDAEACTPCEAGRYNDEVKRVSCTPCSAGTYTNKTGQVTCVKCSPGHINTETGQSSCSTCDLGYFSDVSNTECVECKQGTFANKPTNKCTDCPKDSVSQRGAVECTACGDKSHPSPKKDICISDGPCKPGEYRDKSGECLSCPKGTFSTNVNSTSCTNCTAGHYQDKKNQTQCLMCPRGTYAKNNMSAECDDCEMGYYNNKKGQASCTPCASGNYTNTTKSLKCKVCPAGNFSSSPGAPSCEACAEGQSTNNKTGAQSCTDCKPGTFAKEEGTANCSVCSAGFYSLKAADSCIPCSPGNFANHTGSQVCLPCYVGSYASDSGSKNCTKCSKGTYANKKGMKSCEKCSPGHYAATNGSIQCSECAKGTYQGSEGASSCTNCSKGYYAGSTGMKSCASCAAGSCQPKEGQSECKFCAKGTYQSKTGQANCLSCPHTTAYIYKTGSTTSDDCVGPSGEIDSSDNTIYNTETYNWKEKTIFTAVKGRWAIRNTTNPYHDYVVIKEGDTSEGKKVKVGNVTIEVLLVDSYCYLDTEGHGKYFNGTQSTDEYGIACMNDAKCRNPDGNINGPYCQVEASGVIKNSTCGIPKCNWNVGCFVDDATGFRGSISTVKHNGVEYTCQSWASGYPHPHVYRPTPYTDEMYGLGNNNYCRNPDPERYSEPWCYTTSFFVRWLPCNVNRCDPKKDKYFS